MMEMMPPPDVWVVWDDHMNDGNDVHATRWMAEVMDGMGSGHMEMMPPDGMGPDHMGNMWYGRHGTRSYGNDASWMYGRYGSWPHGNDAT